MPNPMLKRDYGYSESQGTMRAMPEVQAFQRPDGFKDQYAVFQRKHSTSQQPDIRLSARTFEMPMKSMPRLNLHSKKRSSH